MRLVSNYGKYSRQYRPKKASVDFNGVETVTQEPVYLQFVQNDIFQNEIDQAMEHFSFLGQFQHEDEATPVDPMYRISTFDTTKQGWDPVLQAEVEAWLLDSEAAETDFFIVKTTPIERPFPNYDEYAGTPKQLVDKLVEDGYDLQLVLDYEQLFGPKRAKVIQVLEEAIHDNASAVVPA